MFNKIKKLANKVKEAVKHVAKKVEEHIMAKEEIELKKMEMGLDAAKYLLNKFGNPKCALIVFGSIGTGLLVATGMTFVVYKKDILG